MSYALVRLLKVSSITLSLYIVCAFGVTISPDTKAKPPFPYYKLGESDDHTKSLYIGATHDYMPMKTPNGDVLIRTMILQDIANNGAAKGEQYEYVLLADCDNQVAKVVIISHRANTNAKVEIAIKVPPHQNIEAAIMDAINKTKPQGITPNTPLSLVVDVACKFVAPHPHVQPKPREWTA